MQVRIRAHRSVTYDKVKELEKELHRERKLRLEAEREAARFHALLLAERVRKL